MTTLDKVHQWLGMNGLNNLPYREWTEYQLREYVVLVDAELARLRDVVKRQANITEGIADLIAALPKERRSGTTSANATQRALAYIRELQQEQQ